MHEITEKQETASSSNSKNTTVKQRKLEDLYNIKISTSEKLLTNACIELVTVNGRPFSIMDDSGFGKIIEPIIKGLGMKTGLSSERIKSLMSNEAQLIRKNISDCVKDKLISLKVDAVTRLDRSFLGEYLKEVIFNTLESYKINVNNIYTITTDNGSNMLKAVKKLRTPTYLYLIKKENLLKPTLDCATRWNSTVDMLVRLKELKNFLNDLGSNDNKFKQFNLNNQEWNDVDILCEGLMPAKICRKILQKEQLTLTDFYANWLLCKIRTKALNSSISRNIVKNMTIRENHILSNDILLSAVFLDPRYKVILTDDQINRAIDHLSKLWTHIVFMKQTQSCDQHDVTIVLSDVSSSSTPSDDSDELDAVLKAKEHCTSVIKKVKSRRIDSLLKCYNLEQERIARKVNILQFWETMKPIHPEFITIENKGGSTFIRRSINCKSESINSVPFEVISVSSSINEDELQDISHSSTSSAKQIMNKKRKGDINDQEGPHQIKKKQLRINNLFFVASQQSEK
ncbi:hypothetical protein ILUMI_01717 [Ignelater luminosus]|uniref:DUF659 domain-containing protein n=1 Tax=Ignelater luminosus TaxID=2038154 RepID=A0A8K0GLZ7_IGNLU|nr:hypothetical protein ILUMI_01717 [Ignelater luminosus]